MGEDDNRAPRGGARLVLLAGMVLAMVFGSIHAFSIFLVPMEAQFRASRATVSLTYSLALVCLTAGVLVGYRVYGWLRPPALAAAICLCGAAGALVAAVAGSLLMVWLGYSLIFGSANGLGYGYALQISAQATPGEEGFAMGLITASYALGAALSPPLLAAAIEAGGVFAAMLGLSLALMVVTPIVAGLLAKARAGFRARLPSSAPRRGDDSVQVALLWLGYGAGVAAGLMAIGHASGIARTAGLTDAQAVAAPAIIALSGIAGSFLGGWLVDRVPVRPLLVALPLVSAMGLFALAFLDHGLPVLLGLVHIGLTYGALIVVYPAAIALIFGPVPGVRIYGRVFTAWGAAGLFAPWFAGYLHDQLASYAVALSVAGSLGLLSSLAAWGVKSPAAAVKTR